VPLKPSASVPTFEQSVAKGLEKDWHDAHTSQSDGDPKRDALRLATLQAANAYALSPCDTTMKANLVAALSAYAQAWADLSGCGTGRCTSSDKILEAGNTAFSTAADTRVHEAVRAAFARHGITGTDFPQRIRYRVMGIAGQTGDSTTACERGEPVRPLDSQPLPVTADMNRAPPPRAARAAVTSDEPWAKNEVHMVHLREIARKGVMDAFGHSWGELCNGSGRKRMLDALAYYYGHRARQTRGYAKNWGPAGAKYIAQAGATTDDARVDRLTQEMYGRGYFHPDLVSSSARGLLKEIVRGERITATPCANAG
jgi:hypothetical protein